MNVKPRGSLLILALWSLSLLAIFCVTLSYSVRQKISLLDRLESLNTLYPIAYSGIEAARGLMKVEDAAPNFDGLNDNWSQNNSLFKDIQIRDHGSFSVSYLVPKNESEDRVRFYGLIDEQSKININTADVATLTRILQLASLLDKDAAEEIAYCIIDWRDPDSTFEHPNYGAEDDYYNNLETPYATKNAPFEMLDELLLVKGINRDIFDKIKTFLTLFGTGQVNINTASKEVLMALGLQERLVNKIIRYRKGEDGEERTADDQVFAQSSSIVTQLNQYSAIDLEETAQIGNLVAGNKLGTTSSHFMIHSQGVLDKNGAYLEIESVIDRKGKIFYLRVSKIQWPSQV